LARRRLTRRETALQLGLVARRLLGADDFEQHMITGVIGSVLALPSSILLITGTLRTYAEIRARNYLTTAADLSSAL